MAELRRTQLVLCDDSPQRRRHAFNIDDSNVLFYGTKRVTWLNLWDGGSVARLTFSLAGEETSGVHWEPGHACLRDVTTVDLARALARDLELPESSQRELGCGEFRTGDYVRLDDGKIVCPRADLSPPRTIWIARGGSEEWMIIVRFFCRVRAEFCNTWLSCVRGDVVEDVMEEK